MKAHDKVIIVVLAAILLIPLSGVLFSEDSDAAADNDYTHYYRDQLTYNQSLIYDALAQLDPASVTKTSVYEGSESYTVEVRVPSYAVSTSTYGALREIVLGDTERAWQATLLDDPFAWWAWSTDNAGVALYASSFKVMDASGTVSGSSVSGLVFYVYIADVYMEGTTIASKVDEARAAMDTLVDDGKVTGDSAVSTIEKINSYLCSSSFTYSTDAKFCNSIYGALVAQTDGKHAILCTGYSQLFKAACDRTGIPCINVVGMTAQSTENGAHMWNQVLINDGGTQKSLAVDATWNATGAGTKSYLLVGSMTTVGGATFSQTHQAFAPIDAGSGLWADYAFKAPSLASEGYSFPTEKDLVASISEYMPWIFAGIVCIILAYILWTIGKKGE